MKIEEKIRDVLNKRENKEGLATYRIAGITGMNYNICKTILEDMAKRKMITKITIPTTRNTYWRIK